MSGTAAAVCGTARRVRIRERESGYLFCEGRCHQSGAKDQGPRLQDPVKAYPFPINQLYDVARVWGLHYTDIVAYNDDTRLYSYGQIVDPLIADGLRGFKLV